MIDATRVCRKCERELSLDMFSKHKESKGGRRWQCKDCQRVQNRNYKDTRGYRPEHRSPTDPWKKRANNAVTRALSNGSLVRPNICDDCCIECKPEAHHESYDADKRLDVVWLCTSCHGLRHRKD